MASALTKTMRRRCSTNLQGNLPNLAYFSNGLIVIFSTKVIFPLAILIMTTVLIEPDSKLYLYFKPSSPRNSAFINLTNLSDRPAAFKIKASHQFNFTVRAHTGLLSPGQQYRVQISLGKDFNHQNLQPYNNNRFQILTKQLQQSQDPKSSSFWLNAQPTVIPVQLVPYSFESNPARSQFSQEDRQRFVVHYENDVEKTEYSRVQSLRVLNQRLKADCGLTSAGLLTPRNAVVVLVISLILGLFH